MVKKRIFPAFIAIFLSVFCVCFSTGVAKAETSDLTSHELALQSGYAEVVAFIDGGGVFTTENVDDLISVSSNAVKSAEYLKETVSAITYDDFYRNMHTDVLQVCKNAHVFKMKNSYDPDIYSPTDGGLTLLHNKLSGYVTAIRTATEYSIIESSYNAWNDFITNGEISLNVTNLETNGDILVKIISAEPLFAEDDKLTASKFGDTIITKNTITAIESSEKLKSQDSGLAYYLSIRWIRDGVVQEKSRASVTVYIDLEDLGLQTATDIQVARYVGGEKVEFIENVVVEDGYLVFTLESLGGDIESQFSLDFAIVAKGYKQAKTNYGIIVIVSSALILVSAIVLKLVFGARRRKKRKLYKSFVKQQKDERLDNVE